jgi:7-keto-8-aminopelargonate synthetase-like enzyme
MPLAPELRFVDRTKVVRDGKTYVFFGGTDYHRMGSHPEVLRAFQEAADTEGLDCAGSRLTTGNYALLVQLERKTAEFLGRDEAACCSGGYLSNTVALEAVREDFQRFFISASAHASVVTPAEALPRERLHPFKDPEDLARELKRRLRPGEKPLVLTDGVVSGSGVIPPLAAYWEAVREMDGKLLVDDSHGLGVVGPTGRGSTEETGLPPRAFILSGTYSKGFGVFGGLVAGDRGLLEKVIRRSRAFVGATPMPPPVTAAVLRGMEILRSHPELITGLRLRTLRMRERMAALGFPTIASPAPIFSVTYGDEARNRRLGGILERDGIFPTFINYPGCPPGGHFRFTLSSAHTDEEVERLIRAIAASRAQ